MLDCPDLRARVAQRYLYISIFTPNLSLNAAKIGVFSGVSKHFGEKFVSGGTICFFYSHSEEKEEERKLLVFPPPGGYKFNEPSANWSKNWLGAIGGII